MNYVEAFVLGLLLASQSVVGAPTASAQGQPGDAGGSFLPVYESGAWRIEDEVCIGDEEDDNYLFAYPYVDVDASGNVFVLDIKLHNVRKFDRNGVYQRTFSGRGEGPGEMGQFAVSMTVTRDGHVVLADFGNARITEFSNDGEYLRDTRLETMVVVPHMESSPDGTIFVEKQRPLEDDFEMLETWLTRYGPDLELLGTVDSLVVHALSMGESRSVWIPYRRGLAWAVAPNGDLVLGRTDENQLKIMSPNMEVVGTITSSRDRVPVTRQDKENFVKESRTERQRAFREVMNLPEWKPAIAGLRIDHEGYVLVCLSDENDSQTTYDIYDLQGRLVSTASLPTLDELTVLRDGFTYFVRRSDEMPPEVCWARLVPTTSGR